MMSVLKRLAVFNLLFFTCISCGIYYELHVAKSGIVAVEQLHFKVSDNDHVEKAKDSPALIKYEIISENKESGGQVVVMEFQTVDSLGKYLTVLKPTTLKFIKSEHSLEIHTSGLEPYTGDAKIYFLTMRIHFEQKVKEVISDHFDVAKAGDHTVYWGKTSRKSLINKGEPAKIKVLLED